MAILPIRKVPDPVLRQKARPVQRVTRRHRRLIEDMKETMYDAPGVGLAANQVGVLERVIVVDPGDRFMALINPEILEAEGKSVDVEGCLSIPGITGYVERAQTVRVRALDERGHPVEFQAEGYLARIIQHEVDHLDGVLFTDRATSLVQEQEQEQEQQRSEAAVSAPRPDGAASGRAVP
ncbi:MAG: peptide deformylase [Bacillota bacterium]